LKLFKFLIIFMFIMSIAVFTIGCNKEEKTKIENQGETETLYEVKESTTTVSNASETEMIRLTLYFPDKEAMYLLAEERDVAKTKAPAEAAIEELIKGPKEERHIAVIPVRTELNGINIEDETAYVDFNEEFKTNYRLGSAAETMTVYSIVNTLTEFSTIKKVKFLVNGESFEIEGSNFDFKIQEFSRNEDLIKEN